MSIEVVQFFFPLQMVSVSEILLINTTLPQQIKDPDRGDWYSTLDLHPLNQPSQPLQFQRGNSSSTPLEQAQSYTFLGS